MPKKRLDARTRRQRDRHVATNLHHDAARTAQKIGYTTEGRRRLIRRITGVFLVSLGLLVMVTHMIVHLADIKWLPTAGMQDLLTGYPMGGLILIGGLIVMSR